MLMKFRKAAKAFKNIVRVICFSVKTHLGRKQKTQRCGRSNNPGGTGDDARDEPASLRGNRRVSPVVLAPVTPDGIQMARFF